MKHRPKFGPGAGSPDRSSCSICVDDPACIPILLDDGDCDYNSGDVVAHFDVDGQSIGEGRGDQSESRQVGPDAGVTIAGTADNNAQHLRSNHSRRKLTLDSLETKSGKSGRASIGSANGVVHGCASAAPEPLRLIVLPSLLVGSQQLTPALHAKISTCMVQLACDDEESLLEGATTLRTLLTEKDPPYEVVVATGAVARVIQLMDQGHGCCSGSSTRLRASPKGSERDSLEPNRKLQTECAWILANLASGANENVELLVSQGVIPPAVRLLGSSDFGLAEQTCWLVANLAGNDSKTRDILLKAGALDALIRLIKPFRTAKELRVPVWAINNFCRGQPKPSFSLFGSLVLPVMARVLSRVTDVDVVREAVDAVSIISEGQNEAIAAVIDCNLLPRLVQLCSHDNIGVKASALRCVGNTVLGTEAQTQAVIAAGFLKTVIFLLADEDRKIRKEAMWTISNIACTSGALVSHIVEANVVPVLVAAASSPLEPADVRREAVWCLANASACASMADVQYLADHGAPAALVKSIEIACGGKSMSVSNTTSKAAKAILAAVTDSGDPKAVPVACKGIETMMIPPCLSQSGNPRAREQHLPVLDGVIDALAGAGLEARLRRVISRHGHKSDDDDDQARAASQAGTTSAHQSNTASATINKRIEAAWADPVAKASALLELWESFKAERGTRKAVASQ